jgi:hypothetical protein
MTTERVKPSELTVIQGAAGQVVEVEPELSPLESQLEAWRQHTYRGSELLRMEPRSWLVPGWLPNDAVAAVYAPPGVGKSFYALSLALEMASGGWWCGAQLPASPVLYVAAERASSLRDRAEAWSSHHRKQLPQSFELLAPPRPPQLTDRYDMEALCETVSRQGARLVVLDTYARMTLGLEENSAKDTGPVLDSLDQLRQATNGGLVLVVHHTGKDPGKGLRGSSAMLGALDSTISLEGSEGTLRAKVEKLSDGEKPRDEWYKLSPVELPGEVEPRSAAVLIETGAPAKNPGLEEAVLGLLRASTAGSMTKKELLEALEEEGRKLSRPSLDRQALKPLLDSGKVTMTGKGPASRYQPSIS